MRTTLCPRALGARVQFVAESPGLLHMGKSPARHTPIHTWTPPIDTITRRRASGGRGVASGVARACVRASDVLHCCCNSLPRHLPELDTHTQQQQDLEKT